MVKEFAERNFLKLNVGKCEVRGCSVDVPECVVDGSVLPAGDIGKCLGLWWKWDLLATRSVDENIKKARRAFFHYGSIGAFQGDLSPLSSRSILDACVMPILLYRCENWLMTHAPLIAQVERRAGWVRLWDAALDYGVSHTRGLQLLSRVLSHHGKGI